MENLKISRIKAAGKNIANIGYLTLVSIGLSLIMYFHISNLKLDQVGDIYIGYGFLYFIISLFFLVNVFSAGKNLINCAIETIDKYEGEWKYGKQHGQGTLTLANGEKYVGEWLNDKRHGQGTYTYADGKIVKGLWENDQYVGE